MSKTLLFKAITILSPVLLVPAFHAQANDATAPEHAASKVRIVRLSMTRGAVVINRDKTRGFEKAIANLPVVEGNEIRTEVGAAEVEFEDNSSLRMAPNSTVQFSELSRNPAGATVSTVHVVHGIAFVSLVKPESAKLPVNQFTLTFGSRKLMLDPATHVRLEIEGAEARLAVLDGAVHLDGADGALNIARKRTATFDLSDENVPTVAKDVEKTPFDQWDHEATSYHAGIASLMASRSAYSSVSPFSYGLSDMMYYGNFMDAGACGNMWRPYFASAAWDPFSNGAWAWYPGAGYSWVSPYPWGWTPYHYGSWAMCPGVGWGWMPGGSWYGVNNVAALVPKSGPGGGISGGPRLPPIHPPQPHEPTLIAVNMKPLVASQVASPTSFEFRTDSAGFGVPRGTLGHLAKFSSETESHGVATTRIYVSQPESGHVGMSSMAASLGASIHRGSPPSSQSESPSNSSISSYGGSSAGASPRSNVSISPSPSAPSGGSKK